MTKLIDLTGKPIECLPAVEFFCALARLSEDKADNPEHDNEFRERMPDIYRMAQFEDIVENNYHKPLTTSKVAEMLHISNRHLSRIINERYGTTLHEVVVKKRLDVAAKLLISTDKPVSNIALTVGFSSDSVFYKEFKEMFSTTPTDYRKNFSRFIGSLSRI